MGLKLSGPLPDETTILNFRHLLEKHGLGQGLLEEIDAQLEAQGLRFREGTIVDASIIEAPSSTKNRARERDPEMHQTKKGNQWHFGMKAHIGVDCETGIVHSMTATAANFHDVTEAHNLLHGGRDGGVGRRRVPRGSQEGGESGAGCGMASGDAAWETRGLDPESPEAVVGKRKASVSARVNVSVSEEANRQVPEAKLCDLEVVTTAGQRHAAQVAYHKGHYKNPLTETEVEDRFRSLASGNLPGDRIDALLAHLWRIDEAADLGEMFGLLRFGG